MAVWTAMGTLGNVFVDIAPASFSSIIATTSGPGNSVGARPRIGQMQQVAMRCTSVSGLLPYGHPSALLPPAVANSVSISPIALQSSSMKLRELSRGFGHGVHVLPWPAVRKSRFGAVRSMAQGKPGAGQIEDLIKMKNQRNPVVVYSKTWCPYCGMVKSLFQKLGVTFLPVELDELVDEQEVQAALQRISGQTTVPNVFIGGQHIGGCDDTMAIHSKGNLIPLLKAAGAKFTPV